MMRLNQVLLIGAVLAVILIILIIIFIVKMYLNYQEKKAMIKTLNQINASINNQGDNINNQNIIKQPEDVNHKANSVFEKELLNICEIYQETLLINDPQLKEFRLAALTQRLISLKENILKAKKDS